MKSKKCYQNKFSSVTAFILVFQAQFAITIQYGVEGETSIGDESFISTDEKKSKDEINSYNKQNELELKSIQNPNNDIYVFTCIAIYSELSLENSYMTTKLKNYQVGLNKISEEKRSKIIKKYLMNAIYNCFTNIIDIMNKDEVKTFLNKIIERSHQDNEIQNYLRYDNTILERELLEMTSEENEVMRQLYILNTKNEENPEINQPDIEMGDNFQKLNDKIERIKMTSGFQTFLKIFGVTLLSIIFFVACIFVRSMSNDEDMIIESIESLRKDKRKITEERMQTQKEIERQLELKKNIQNSFRKH